jgi:hypothetical protein
MIPPTNHDSGRSVVVIIHPDFWMANHRMVVITAWFPYYYMARNSGKKKSDLRRLRPSDSVASRPRVIPQQFTIKFTTHLVGKI